MIPVAQIFRSDYEEDTGLTYEKVAPYLHIHQKKKDGVLAECPICHDPKHLYVTDKGDKVLMYCHKCNADFKDIIRALGITGGKEPTYTNLPTKKDNAPIKRITAEEYDHIYRNPDGSIAYFKHRVKYTDGSKRFQFGYRDEEGKQHFQKPEGSINLYNLDLLQQAINEGATDILYIVEGEKCADAMVAHGLLATTSNTGAQKRIKLTETDSQILSQFTSKVVIPDNDDKGMDYANAWQGADVLPMVSFWQECPPKGDVADYFQQGGDPEKITSVKFAKAEELDVAYINELDANEIIGTDLFEGIFSIKEPLRQQQVIGYAVARAKALGMARVFNQCWKAFKQQKAAEGITSENMTKFPEQLFSLRCGEWVTSSTGVRKLVSKDGDNFGYETASPIPIMPIEILENIEDGTEKLRLAFYKYGSWKNFPIQRSTVASNQSIIQLADIGVEVNSDNAKLLVKYLADTIALNPDILPRSKSISHLGWVGEIFVPYCEDIKIDSEKEFESIYNSIAERGTLEEWAQFIQPLRENLYLRLTMAASFASPLISIIKTLPFIFHLWGGTGSGKTVALMVAASIWGNPGMGKMVRSLNSTANAMMTTAAFLKNIPFFGDELQTIKSRFGDYDSLIMKITEGVDRGRMSADAILKKQSSWANTFLFTGEEPCTQLQSGGGVKNRVIEIAADKPIICNGNEVVNFIAKHYGCAGKEFINYIITCNKDDILRRYQENFNLINSLADTTAKQAGALALMALADEIASGLFFKGERGLDADEIAGLSKQTKEIDPANRAWEVIKGTIVEHAAYFRSNSYRDENFEEKHSANEIIWGRFRENSQCVINKSILTRELKKNGFDFDAVKKPWADAGYLQKSNGGMYYISTTIEKVTTYCVILNLAK